MMEDFEDLLFPRTEANMANFPAERDTMLFAIKQKKAKDQYDLMMDSVMAQLRADKKLVIHEDTLKKLAASYRQNR